jgi:hypothetical protein
VESGFEAPNRTEIQREEVEKERTVGFRRQGDHLPLLFFRGFVVNALQVRRFTAQSGAVIDDFAVDLAGGEIDETQKSPQLSVARRYRRKERRAWGCPTTIFG